jgi:hypothetical protein
MCESGSLIYPCNAASTSLHSLKYLFSLPSFLLLNSLFNPLLIWLFSHSFSTRPKLCSRLRARSATLRLSTPLSERTELSQTLQLRRSKTGEQSGLQCKYAERVFPGSTKLRNAERLEFTSDATAKWPNRYAYVLLSPSSLPSEKNASRHRPRFDMHRRRWNETPGDQIDIPPLESSLPADRSFCGARIEPVLATASRAQRHPPGGRTPP